MEADRQLRRRLGTRIRALRQERGLTQPVLGERAGFSVNFVSEVERGLRNPRLDTVHRLAAALDTSLADLLAGIDRPADRVSDRAAPPMPVKWSVTPELRRLGVALDSLPEPLARPALAVVTAFARFAKAAQRAGASSQGAAGFGRGRRSPRSQR